MITNNKGGDNMINTFTAKTNKNTIIVKNNGFTTAIATPQGNGKKPKLIDIAFGDFNAIVRDLKIQGFTVKII